MLLLLVFAAEARTLALGDGLLADQWTSADGLPLDHAKDVAFTPDGYAWVATFEGVLRFDGARFTAMPDAWVTALGTRRVAALAVDPKDGALWMMAEERGVARWRDGELRAWTPEELGGTAKGILERPEGNWLVTTAGVLRLEGAPVREPWTSPVGELAAFVPLPDGRALCASDAGVAWLESGGVAPRQLGAAEGADAWVRTIEAGADGEITAVIGDRVRVWDGERFVDDTGEPACTILYALPHSCAPQGAPASPWGVTERGITYDGREVLALHARAEGAIADPRGDVWIPTSADGLLRLRHAILRHLPGDPADPRVDRVQVDSADRLWARSAADWKWRVFPPGDRTALPVPTATGWTYEIDPGDFLLLRRGAAQHARIDGDTLVASPPVAVAIGPTFDLLRTPSGTLLAGDDGLAHLVDGLPVPLPTQGEVVHTPRALAAQEDGAVAIGTRSDGLLVLDHGVARRVGGAGDRLVGSIRHLRREADVLWAATEEEGLCAVLPDGGWANATWRCLRPGGSVRGVHASLSDGRGRTWLSTNVGLWVARDDALDAFAHGEGPAPALLRLGVEAGMARAEANGPYGGVVARDSSGVIWFPTQDGVVGVDPARFTFPEAPRVRLDTPPGPMELARGEELTLSWSAPVWAWADQLEYQTRLGDGPWSTTPDRSITLARLPPGPFTFAVRAGLAGAWGPEATIAGVRRSEWDEGSIPWILGVGAAVLGGAWAVRLRTRTLRRRQATLEREVEERTAEVRSQASALAARNATLAEQAGRLAELEELRTRAIVNLHHELRTPLTLVMGGVARLPRPVDPKEAAAHELVLRNASRLETLMGQLADVARLERGEVVPRTRRLELPRAAAALVARFEGLAGERGVTLVGPPPAAEPHVWVDPDIFEKILGNLVHNALKFTPPKGRVTVRVGTAGEHVRVEVCDTGIGVPDHARERVFDRLYQVEHGDDRPHGGSGIGLALARELTELSGGEIGHAPNPGGGTCFWFSLPGGSAHVLADEVAVDAPESVADDGIEGPEGAPLVLVVEDNADMRAWFVEELREGWRVAMAVDGEHGLARARALSPALVVSDVMMPRMDGLTLARRLRAEGRTPILLVSAKAGPTDREEALSVADGWLSKPFSSSALREQVRRLCGVPEPAVAEPAPATRPEADTRFLARLEAAVDARLADPDFDVPALAQAVATSERTLQRELARIIGVSPARWIREHRLGRAEEMLRRGDRRTVSEVAAAVGMSRAWFTRMYRAWAGRPPGEDLPDFE